MHFLLFKAYCRPFFKLNSAVRDLLMAVLITSIGFSAHAQIGAGQTAPDWTITDIDGTEHNLYAYLDEGYSVVLTTGAVWSSASWDFHQSGVLSALYETHGPAGQPGVAAETTDDLVVIFTEADPETDGAALIGLGEETQGDWTEGISYPIADLVDNSFLGEYELSGFPNTWIICPNRTVQISYAGYDHETMTADAIYAEASQCSAAFGQVNPAIAAYTGPTEVGCFGGEVMLSVTLQNMGLAAMESATIQVFQGGISVIAATWTGNLATYEFAEFNVGSVEISESQSLLILITSEDEEPGNAQVAPLISTPGKAGTDVEVRFYTDFYPAESAWYITNSEGATVASGGPYMPGNADPDGGGGADANAVMVHSVALTDAIDCYNITVTDTEGDGLLYGENPADKFGIEVFFQGQSVSDNPLGEFGFEAVLEEAMQSDPALSTEAVLVRNDWSIYPNPAGEFIRVMHSGPGPATLHVFDLTGKILLTRSLPNSGGGSHEHHIDLSSMEKGIYLVRMDSDTGHFDTKKLVIGG